MLMGWKTRRVAPRNGPSTSRKDLGARPLSEMTCVYKTLGGEKGSSKLGSQRVLSAQKWYWGSSSTIPRCLLGLRPHGEALVHFANRW